MKASIQNDVNEEAVENEVENSRNKRTSSELIIMFNAVVSTLCMVLFLSTSLELNLVLLEQDIKMIYHFLSK